jgi:DNA-binding NarL/FixJ family response regulator
VISIAIVDDEEMVAAAMSALCEKVDGVEVVGRANNGRDGLALIERLRPHVAMVDLIMSELNGIDLIALVRRKGLSTRTVVLTGSPDRDLCARAMEAGACAYLLKRSCVEELGIAIQAAAGGKVYITPAMADLFVRREPSAHSEAKHLTLRQREILQLVVEGKTTKDIACTLNVSIKTVEKHRADVMRRLDVRSTAALVSHAILHRLVMLPI